MRSDWLISKIAKSHWLLRSADAVEPRVNISVGFLSTRYSLLANSSKLQSIFTYITKLSVNMGKTKFNRFKGVRNRRRNKPVAVKIAVEEDDGS